MDFLFCVDGASGDDRDQAEPTESAPKEMVDFKVVYNKKKLDVTFLLDETVLELKKHLEKITGLYFLCYFLA